MNFPKCTSIGDYNFYQTESYTYVRPQTLTVSGEGCLIGSHCFGTEVAPTKIVGKITSVGESSFHNLGSSANPLDIDWSTITHIGAQSFSKYNGAIYFKNQSVDFSSLIVAGSSSGYNGCIFSTTSNSGSISTNLQKMWLPETCERAYFYFHGRSANDPVHIYTNATAGKSSWYFGGTTSTDSKFTTGSSSPYVILHTSCTHEDFENGIYNS